MSLSTAEDERPFVKGLIGGKSHFQIISDSHEKQPALRKIQSCLPDDLIE